MAQQEDFYLLAASQRASVIEAELAAARADLAAHRANQDVDSASVSVQAIANLETEKANLNALYQNYVASQQPPQPEPVTDQERAARPWQKMDYSDTWAMAANSKYGVDENAFRQGMAEVARRRARGE